MRVALATLALVGLLVAAMAAGAGPAVAGGLLDLDDPSPWPSAPGADPDLSPRSNSLRISGPDRYQTNLAALLTLRGLGQFPFGTSDRTSGNAPRLADASDWWGPARCPAAVVVVAGDTFADALAASVLSDPTDLSTEPFLPRVAAADPDFDPIGAFDRVDTDAAPIVVTTPARAGSTGLTLAGQIGVQDLARGGCQTARSAVIVGGPSAVPVEVEGELLTLGYAEVFRVAGADRADTAARVARALGTGTVPAATSCADSDSRDGVAMGFYGNAVVELRESATTCRLLDRTVVLTDGVTGADALAAGWWTSYWQVPVLLTGAGGTLPPATRDALATLDVGHVVVLGGTGRIPDATVQEAAAVAGAEAVRIAGPSRAATSAEMARLLGGWWPATPAAFSGSVACLAASGGDGPTAQGWPDALGAGPWCGALSVPSRSPGAPDRALPATNGPTPRTTGAAGVGRHAAAPILLVEPGAETLPEPVSSLLADAFAPGGDWCTSDAPPASCANPGFAVAFGGTSVISAAVLDQATAAVGGGEPADGTTPTLRSGFPTALDMAPVFRTYGPASTAGQGCVVRGAADRVRWLAATATPERLGFAGQADLMLSGAYRTDADGVARSPGASSPSCLRVTPPSGGIAYLSGISLFGRMAPDPAVLDLRTSRRIALAAPALFDRPTAVTGPASSDDRPGVGTTTLTFEGGAGSIVIRGVSTPLTGVSLTIALTRGTVVDGVRGPDTAVGAIRLVTAAGEVTGEFEAEALKQGDTWRIRGALRVSAGTVPGFTTGVGGFWADLDTNGAGSVFDDTLLLNLDAAVT